MTITKVTARTTTSCDSPADLPTSTKIRMHNTITLRPLLGSPSPRTTTTARSCRVCNLSSVSTRPFASQSPLANLISNPYADKSYTILNPCRRQSISSTDSSFGCDPSHLPRITATTGVPRATWNDPSLPKNKDSRPSTIAPPLPSIYHYPTLLDQGRTYPDIRAQYCLLFCRATKDLVQHSYQRMSFDQMCGRVTQLALEALVCRLPR